jgi:predicted Zn-dependent peptidase
MKPKRDLLQSWLAIFGLAVVSSSLSAQEKFHDIQSRVTEFTLTNGMKFLALERHQAPVASFHTYADVGSVQETWGITGLAHVFEHMAFKGTRTIGTKDFTQESKALEKVDQAFEALRNEQRNGKADAQKLKQLEADFKQAQEEAGKAVVSNEFGDAIEKAGGRGLNATTSSDRTVYYFSLPSNASELWFYLESERFLDPVLREFYKECNVVMEERRMGIESNPIGKLIEEFLAIAYKAHPYGTHTLGHMSDLQSLTRADAEAFFKKHYLAHSLIAAIVGDIEPQQVRQWAETYFGRLPAGTEPEPFRTVEPAQEGERRVTLRLQSQRVILTGYHKPDINHPDNAVYDAIGSLLSEGRSSRLYRSLVRDKKIATNAGGFPGFPGQKYPGLFVFYAFTAPGHTNDEIEKALDEEINRLKNETVSKEELDGVKRRARANLIRQLDDNSGMAAALAAYQGLTGDWRNLFKQLDQIEAVTAADIKRVTTGTFAPGNRTVGVIEPIETAAAK